MGALLLSGALMLSAAPLPPPAAALEATEEAAEAPAISRFASPAEKRAAMAARRLELLRQAREEAEAKADATSTKKAEPKKAEAAAPSAGTDLQSMLKSIQSAVSGPIWWLSC